MKKYELTNETIKYGGKNLYRIKALIDFGNVKKGTRGGFIEKEENLSASGNAWVSGDAWVCGNAQVSGDAWVCGNAQVSGNAHVCGNAKVCGNAQVSGEAKMCSDAWVYKNIDHAEINGFGTCGRHTTFFRCKDKTVKVSCGCFLGTIDEFRNQVKNTRGGKIAKEYLMIADLMEMHFCEAEDEYDD